MSDWKWVKLRCLQFFPAAVRNGVDQFAHHRKSLPMPAPNFPQSNTAELPRQPRIVARTLQLLLPVLVLSGGWFAFTTWIKPEEKKRRPASLPQAPKSMVVELEVVDFEPLIETNGVIRAHNEVNLTAQVGGPIVKIHPQFEDGAFFEKGMILLELDNADFATAVSGAKAQLAQAVAVHAQEETRAKQALRDWRDLGFEEEPSDLVLRLPQLREAEARVDAAQSRLEQAERNLERCLVRAPFDGRVRRRMVGVSQTIGSGAPLASIFAIDFAEVRLPINTNQIRFLNLPEEPEDKPVELELADSLDEAKATTWKARIVRTEGTLNDRSLDLFAIARIEDPFGRKTGAPPLRIGQPVMARIPGRPLREVVVIPREAVRQLSRITIVDRESLTIRKHSISPIWENTTHVIVRDEALQNGTLLATANFNYTPDGSVIEILPSPADNDDPVAAKSEVQPSTE